MNIRGKKKYHGNMTKNFPVETTKIIKGKFVTKQQR